MSSRTQPTRRNYKRQAPRPRAYGFTMIEMVIAVLVLGILAATAAPRYHRALNRFRVDAAARRIAADVNHVRRRAWLANASGHEWIRFDAGDESYRLYGDPDPDRPAEEYRVDLQKTAYPVELVSAAFTNSYWYTHPTTVRIDRYGRAYSGQPPFLPVSPLSSGQIVIRAGVEERTVSISPITGEATVQ